MSKNCGHTGNCNCATHPPTEIDKLAKVDINKALDKFEDVKQNFKEEISKHEEDRRKKPMVHLHLNTYHSILDGCGSIDNYVKLAREYNHPAIAITDHGTLSGTFEM